MSLSICRRKELCIFSSQLKREHQSFCMQPAMDQRKAAAASNAELMFQPCWPTAEENRPSEAGCSTEQGVASPTKSTLSSNIRLRRGRPYHHLGTTEHLLKFSKFKMGHAPWESISQARILSHSDCLHSTNDTYPTKSKAPKALECEERDDKVSADGNKIYQVAGKGDHPLKRCGSQKKKMLSKASDEEGKFWTQDRREKRRHISMKELHCNMSFLYY